jgi:hypothetical protein
MLTVIGAVLTVVSVTAQGAPPTYRPISDDPVAAAAHAKLTSRTSLLDLVAIYGSNARIKPDTGFTSQVLQARLAKASWPTRRDSPFEFAPDPRLTKGVFDLADAYTYCYIAHIELAGPRFARDGDSFRPWPTAKIRRQFQRALSNAPAITQEGKEHLYFALVRSAANAHKWWKSIEMSVTAIGDVIGSSPEDGDFVIKWLMGVPVDKLECEFVRAGVQRVVMPRPRASGSPQSHTQSAE